MHRKRLGPQAVHTPLADVFGPMRLWAEIAMAFGLPWCRELKVDRNHLLRLSIV
jgi:hypothetical protein